MVQCDGLIPSPVGQRKSMMPRSDAARFCRHVRRSVGNHLPSPLGSAIDSDQARAKIQEAGSFLHPHSCHNRRRTHSPLPAARQSVCSIFKRAKLGPRTGSSTGARKGAPPTRGRVTKLTHPFVLFMFFLGATTMSRRLLKGPGVGE